MKAAEKEALAELADDRRENRERDMMPSSDEDSEEEAYLQYIRDKGKEKVEENLSDDENEEEKPVNIEGQEEKKADSEKSDKEDSSNDDKNSSPTDEVDKAETEE